MTWWARQPSSWQATVQRTNVMAWAVSAQTKTSDFRSHPLQNQLPNHSNEPGICSDCCGANHVQADGLTMLARFGVQIVKHFHMIGNKSDWSHRDVGDAFGLQVGKMLQNV